MLREVCVANETLKRNRGIIETRWPSLFAALQDAPPPAQVSWSERVEATLVINGVHLSSQYDIYKEASLQAQLVPLDSHQAWVYGSGVGALPRVLLNRPALEKLTVVVLNPAVFYQCLLAFDQSDWLADPRLSIEPALPADMVHFPFAASPACLRLADEAATRLRDQVILELATPFINKYYTQAEYLQPRIETNLPLIAQDGDVAELFGALPGGTAYVAAAGPTLSDHFDWLRDQSSAKPLIAVDAALKPLAQHGILPDVVVAIDEKSKSLDFFKFDLTGLKDTRLVYFPAIGNEILRIWPGPRLAAYPQGNSRFKALAEQYPRGELFSRGSVLHPAVDIAVKMGATRVVLLGADFSFPRRYTHVEGSVRAEPVGPLSAATRWVFNGRHERLPSRADFVGFLRDLEAYIYQHPQVIFINASRDGARIEGASYLDGI